MRRQELSQAQLRVWQTQQKYPRSSMFQIGGTVIVDGALDFALMRGAFQELVEAYQALRLRFVEIEGTVYQYEAEDVCAAVDLLDFSTEKDPALALRRWCREQAETPFDLTAFPLYQFVLFKLSDTSGGYYVKLHHLIADGWSMKLLTEFLAEAYERRTDAPCTLRPRERTSYLSYAASERYQTGETDGVFWKELLDQEINWPPQTYANELRAKRLSFILPEPLQRDVERFLHDRSLSLNTLFIAAYLFYRYKACGEKHPVIGIPLLGRSGKRERDIFGNFTNTMPFTHTIHGEKTVWNTILSIADAVQLALCHQKYPQNALREHVRRRQDVMTLYDTCVNFYNTSLQRPIGGMKTATEELFNGQQEYALQIVLHQWTGEEIQVDIDYRVDRYTDDEASLVYKRLLHILKKILVASQAPIASLDIIPELERTYFLYGWNATDAPYPRERRCIELFEEKAAVQPDAVAVYSDENTLTYAGLLELATKFAGYLQTQGISGGDVVAIVPSYTAVSVAFILAIMMCDAIYMPIDGDVPARRLEELLKESQAKFVLTDGVKPHFGGVTLFMDRTCDGIYESAARRCPYAYLLYTSGSSGRPKGVRVRHRSLLNYLWWAKERYLRGNREVFALYSSFAFDFTMTSLFLPLISGGAVRLYGHQREENVFTRILAERQTTILKITPSHIPLILDADGTESSIHTLILGGEDLKQPACAALYRHFHAEAAIYNEYGPTEATVGCMTYRYHPDSEPSGSVPIGTPIHNTSVYLLDADKQPVPIGIRGEMYIGGEGIADEYFRLPHETAVSFIDNPFVPGTRLYKTGDFARRLASGNLLYRGRSDTQIKLRGNRIELDEVEQAILDSPSVRDVRVAVKAEHGQDYLAAYLIPAESYDQQALLAELEARLPSYMIPTRFCALQSFPLTVNGKVDMEKLPAIPLSAGADVEPADVKHGETLLQVMREVLTVETVRLEDNYYGLGGDSIQAIQIASRLRDKQLELSVRDILLHPVVSAMAAYIHEATAPPQEERDTQETRIDLPMVRWFFEQDFVQTGQYNQAVRLRLKAAVTNEQLQSIGQQLIRRHERLRLNYQTDGVSYSRDEEEALRLEEVLCPNIETYTPPPTIFDLQKDRLIRFFLIKTPTARYLHIVAHHLAIDGVSWRILLDELSSLMEACINGEPAMLERPRDVLTLARPRGLTKAESTYWRSVYRQDGAALLHVTGRPCTYGETLSYPITFDPAITPRRLAAVNQAYRAHTGEWLLLSLARALRAVFQSDDFLFEIEGHGRDRDDSASADRSLGWHTVLYPWLCRLSREELPWQIAAFHKPYKEAETHKFSWEDIRGDTPYDNPIRFNYLGDLQADGSPCFDIEPIVPALETAGENRFASLIEVDVLFFHQRLCAQVTYTPHCLSAETMRRLGFTWQQELATVLTYMEKEQHGTNQAMPSSAH